MRESEGDAPSNLKNAFLVTGLRVEGANCQGTTVNLSDMAFSMAPLTVLRWYSAEDAAKRKTSSEPVGVPLYLNVTRAELITVVNFQPQAKVPHSVFYRRAIAMMCSSLSGIVE